MPKTMWVGASCQAPEGKVPLLTYVGESGKTAKEHLADNYASSRDTAGKALAKEWLATRPSLSTTTTS